MLDLDPMEPAVIAALVSSAGALIVAVWAARSARRSMRLKIVDEATRRSINDLRMAIQELQALKDSISVLLNAVEDSLPASDALDLVRKHTTRVVETFAASTSSLDRAEQRAFHEAKNIAFGTHQRLAVALTRIADASALPPEERVRLIQIRQELTFLQQELQVGLTARITGLVL